MNDGGPAFPAFSNPGSRESYAAGGVFPFGGMSLRDYFAAKAMADVLHGFNWERENIQKAAALSYKIADAMVAERTNSP